MAEKIQYCIKSEEIFQIVSFQNQVYQQNYVYDQ